MKISCNILKKHIKNSESIDWLKVWDKFTIRTAEVEGVEVKGNGFDGVVVGQIMTCENHPESKKLHVLTVDVGDEVLQIVCGAPNVRVGLKVALVRVGGRIDTITIGKRPLVGIDSYGMCCSGRELGISDDHAGIVELPDHYVIGTDIKKYLTEIDDIIVEIDNKSLTNRPDLWGHYGIAREIAAITGTELIDMELEELVNNKQNLTININNSDLCFRYTGIKLDNLSKNETPLWMKTFLYYAGMRSISLLVDITNYIMLELGQPMHAFDSRKVSNIEVGLANDGDTFTTLDGIERTLTNEDLMIKNNNDYIAIAGVMGGLESEVLEDTSSIILESASFLASSVRKTASRLSLRTEASARFEKSLDPNMAEIATKRFIKILKDIDNGVVVSSNFTDVYPTVLKENNIDLSKELLNRYMGHEMDSKIVVEILTGLGFIVNEKSDSYNVVVPTYRSTKDVTVAADLIEEVSRMYGYENFVIEPLKLALTFDKLENDYDQEYEVKNYLASAFNYNEVHTYIWNNNSLMKSLNIENNNIKLLGKSEDNTLRDSLTLSLLGVAETNFKYNDIVNVYEIGSVFKNNESTKVLELLLGNDNSRVEELYNEVKLVVNSLFNRFKNVDVKYVLSSSDNIYVDGYSYNILVNDEVYGSINIIHPKVVNTISKKKAIVNASIDFTKFINLSMNSILYKDVSKYPEVSLDYTIVVNSDIKYSDIHSVLNDYRSDYIIKYSLVDLYKRDGEAKYTVRYLVGSNTKTLSQDELEEFKNKFIEHIKKNGYSIIE